MVANDGAAARDEEIVQLAFAGAVLRTGASDGLQDGFGEHQLVGAGVRVEYVDVATVEVVLLLAAATT
jgi:hypothetical protein